MRTFVIGILMASAAVSSGLAAPGSGQDRNSTEEQAHKQPVARHSTVPATSQQRHIHQTQGSELRAHPPAATPKVRTARPVERRGALQTSPSEPRPIERGRKAPAEQRRKIVAPGPEIRPNQDARSAPVVLPKRPVVSPVPRPGTEPPLKTQNRPAPKPQWNSRWRNNQRYDWHNWRRHHRDRFHLHVYIDPFGWGYYRYWVGWRLWPGYYASRYWISDPWYYRLPPAPPGTRWVRYYNDALLVDIWTGEVVDVIHDFFW